MALRPVSQSRHETKVSQTASPQRPAFGDVTSAINNVSIPGRLKQKVSQVKGKVAAPAKSLTQIDPRFAKRLGTVHEAPKTVDPRSREIPLRSAMASADSVGRFTISSPSWQDTSYQANLRSALFNFPHESRMLIYSAPSSKRVQPFELPKIQAKRFNRILDLPNYKDDFYQNKLAWGNKSVAVAMQNTVYFYDYSTQSIRSTYQCDGPVTAVSWNPNLDNRIAIAVRGTGIICYDVDKEKPRAILESDDRIVYSIDWRNSQEFSFGSTNAVGHYDMRTKEVDWLPGMEKTSRVCAARWSGSENRLAIGCNRNKVIVFDANNRSTLISYSHNAGIKALAWQPGAASHHLFSGGGTADCGLKKVDTASKKLMASFDTHAQICGLVWLTKKIFVVAHGYKSDDTNNIAVYYFHDDKNTFHKIGQLEGQIGRILDIAKDPNSTLICTASSNESLAFWDPLDCASKPKQKATPSLLSSFSSTHTIR